MTLSEWAAQHPDEIIAEDASRAAVPSLVAVVAREVADAAGVPSDDGRLEHAFAACVTAARAALAACGYRIRSSAHLYLAIESLEYTLGIPRDEVHRLQTDRRMRARAMYDQVGIASRRSCPCLSGLGACDANDAIRRTLTPPPPAAAAVPVAAAATAAPAGRKGRCYEWLRSTPPLRTYDAPDRHRVPTHRSYPPSCCCALGEHLKLP